jgi:VIT1/CCC1 family predicted Fe2+/Mn2+ transporter
VSLLSSTMLRLRVRRVPIVPHAGPTAGEQRPSGGKSGAIRAAIFGANDGLVSNVSLIMGVAGAGVENKVIILAGIAGLLAGAFSMAAGEYISMRVQREVFERLIHLEAHEIGTDPDYERIELTDLYIRKGISADLAARLAEELMRDPEVALETHAREELGLDPKGGLGSPWAASGSSFATFSIGACIPLIPFSFLSGNPAVIVSAALSLVSLFVIGAGMSFLTGRKPHVSGLRMMALGAAAAAITYGVGSLLGATTGL